MKLILLDPTLRNWWIVVIAKLWTKTKKSGGEEDKKGSGKKEPSGSGMNEIFTPSESGDGDDDDDDHLSI